MLNKDGQVLVVIWVLTHFKEMSRLVRFLQSDSHWQPVVVLGFAASAPAAAKDEWDRTGVPWFIFGSSLAQSRTSGERPTPSASKLLAWLGRGLATIFALLMVIASGTLLLLLDLFLFLPMLAGQFIAPNGSRAKLTQLRQQLSGRMPQALAALAALFLYPSWMLTRRALKTCTSTSRLAQAEWVASRLLLKGLVVTMQVVFYLHERVPVSRLLFRIAALHGMMRKARAACAAVRPEVVALAEDNPSYPTAIFIKAGREHGARSVIIPYTLANTKEFVEGFGADRGCRVQRPSNWLVAKLLPRWCHCASGRGILRLPSHHALAMHCLGVAPQRPWIPNDGYWDAFAVESPRMLRRYVDEFGLRPERLVLTGAMTDDSLWQSQRRALELREEVYRELGLPPGRPMVLVALPPNQFMAQRPAVEFSSYDDMTRFFVETLARLAHCNVVVSLHPRAPVATKGLIETLGGKVSARDTLELVPACAVYVASVSATIRWAIAAGVPVINYDLFHYGYDDYDSAAGVITVQTKSAWLKLLDEVRARSEWFADWAKRQAACSSAWGLVDGGSGRRIAELFDGLARGTAEAPAAGTLAARAAA